MCVRDVHMEFVCMCECEKGDEAEMRLHFPAMYTSCSKPSTWKMLNVKQKPWVEVKDWGAHTARVGGDRAVGGGVV